MAIRSMNVRQLTLQLLSLTLIVTSALMIWKSLCLYTHSESPVVVVLSGSMEPAFKRGDFLFLSLMKYHRRRHRRRRTENESRGNYRLFNRRKGDSNRTQSHQEPFPSFRLSSFFSSSSSSSSSSLPPID